MIDSVQETLLRQFHVFWSQEVGPLFAANSAASPPGYSTDALSPPKLRMANQNHQQERRCAYRDHTYYPERPNILTGLHPGQEWVNFLMETTGRMLQGIGLYSLRPKQAGKSHKQEEQHTDQTHCNGLFTKHKLTTRQTTGRGRRNMCRRPQPEGKQTLHHQQNRCRASMCLAHRPTNQQ